MANKPTFPVGVDVFVVRDGKVLLGQRNHGFGNGLWCLPGGHMEPHEGIEDVAKRELNEETGLTAGEIQFKVVFNNNHNHRDEHYLHFGVEARSVSGDVKLMEPNKFSAWQWFDLATLPMETVYPPHIALIEAFKKGTAFIGHSAV